MYYILAWLGFAALTYLYAWWDTNYFYRRWNEDSTPLGLSV